MVEEPLPINAASYGRFLQEHRLMGTRCDQCNSLYLPPRAMCSFCYGGITAWVPIDGQGKLNAFTFIYVVPAVLAEMGYGRDRPYCTGVVELNDGPKISARILGVATPADVRLGMSLVVDFSESNSESPALAFRPST